MNRRDFLRTAGGATAMAGAVGASGSAAAQSSKEVVVGPGGSLVFEPTELYVSPGTTVNFVWESDGHNIVVDSQPEGANWEGTEGGATKLYDTGHEYSHTFETTGTYEYACEPHRTAGMLGTVIVNESGQPPSAGGGGPVDPKHMGVPIQAHFVGFATVLMIFVSLIFTFFMLKYGESPHASGGNR
ncbi:plastocyanin/azurin family copper-binding protein [Halorarius halobius]|uniref:plastocyanin/azurin family copper-binding protein n=1 Tax=Halorarius halobius TaxID=2962671 RepID=UPI0020CFD677|nr:plastocyanin/azurin family copper-binding protein [Halorarius halobius]